jgi:NADH dehydrogenase FAD-containing subunit
MGMEVSASRRQFVQTASIGAAAVATVGCASVVTQDKGPRVVVVGGGWGGGGTARALLQSGVPMSVTLIEPNERFMSCPLSTHYVTGHAPAEFFEMSYASLVKGGVSHVRARVKAIDRSRKVVVAGDRNIAYDFLVLSPGIEYMEEAMPGFAEGRSSLPVGFRMFEQTAVRQEFERYLETGGDFVITVPKPPYRCPPAPYERAALMAEVIQKRRVKGRIVVLDENPNPMPPPIAKPILASFGELYKNQIEYVNNVELRGVDARSKVVATSKGDVRYQAANLVLPMRAPALVREAGLGQRWADVKLPTFLSAVDESVYVIGDACGLPLPKSGHLAFETGQLVARHIASRAKSAGMAAPAATMPNGICWAYMTAKEAIGIHVATSWEPGGPPKLQFKVDPARNMAAGDGAMQWGRSMWNTMFG